MFTELQLNDLKDAYARGVLKIREGDTWVEFQSMKEMSIAISEIEKSLSNTRPSGSRLVTVSKGY
jgi:hypothetical protein